MPSKGSSVSWFIIYWKPCWHFIICPWTDKQFKSSNAESPNFESPLATVLMSMKGLHDYQTSRCRITVRQWPISQRCTCKQRCYWRNSSVAHLLMAAGTVSRANICHQTTEPWNEIATAAAQDLGWDSICGNQDSQWPISTRLRFLRCLHRGRLITYACKNLQCATASWCSMDCKQIKRNARNENGNNRGKKC